MTQAPFTLLASLSQVLNTVAQTPEPSLVAGAVVDALAPPIGVSQALILSARPPFLVPYVANGSTPLGQAIDLRGDDPAASAYREGQVLSEVHGPTASADCAWTSCVSLRSAGRPVGVMSLRGRGSPPSTSPEIALLEGIGHALGLWLTHPDSGLPSTHPLDRSTLTQRQLQILDLVAAGRTNASVAAALRFSESTVKQEMRNILQRLEVASRSAAVRRAIELGLLEAPRP